jgi:aldose 1-epimerase
VRFTKRGITIHRNATNSGKSKLFLNNRSEMKIHKFITIGLVGGIILSLGCTNQGSKKENTLTEEKMEVVKESFGKTEDNQEVFLYTLTNANGVVARVTNYGCILTSLSVPDKDGNFEDIVLGFDNLQSYLDGHPYFGAIVGRYGNRIAKGKFSVDGMEYTLAVNNGENHLHGGLVGFDKVVWEVEEVVSNEKGQSILFSYLSKDMEEGYPGNLTVKILYSLTADNEFTIEYEATTDKACPVNLSHHSYFNLNAGKSNVHDHEMMINADRYVVVDESLIPTGELRPVEGTPMDFLTPHTIGSRIEQVEGGYDHTYVLNESSSDMILVARVTEPVSGRIMEVFTSEPGVQFYTGNFLDGTLTGKNGIVYEKQFGFCLETQHFPDSPNQPDFPSTLLRPGETYFHLTRYKFSVVP